MTYGCCNNSFLLPRASLISNAFVAFCCRLVATEQSIILRYSMQLVFLIHCVYAYYKNIICLLWVFIRRRKEGDMGSLKTI